MDYDSLYVPPSPQPPTVSSSACHNCHNTTYQYPHITYFTVHPSFGIMLSSHSSALGKFFQIHKEAENWTAGPIRIPIAKSFSDDSIITINLTDTIGKNKKVPKPFQRSDDNCYWLQKSLSENNYDVRQKTIYPLFFRACHSALSWVHNSCALATTSEAISN